MDESNGRRRTDALNTINEGKRTRGGRRRRLGFGRWSDGVQLGAVSRLGCLARRSARAGCGVGGLGFARGRGSVCARPLRSARARGRCRDGSAWSVGPVRLVAAGAGRAGRLSAGRVLGSWARTGSCRRCSAAGTWELRSGVGREQRERRESEPGGGERGSGGGHREESGGRPGLGQGAAADGPNGPHGRLGLGFLFFLFFSISFSNFEIHI
jgi:hypothetical protein